MKPEGHERSGDEGSDERAQAFPGAPQRVGSDELVGASGDCGHERDLRRADRRACHGRDGGEGGQLDQRELVLGGGGAGRRYRECRPGWGGRAVAGGVSETAGVWPVGPAGAGRRGARGWGGAAWEVGGRLSDGSVPGVGHR